jgi:dephospho-CoA kinase
MKLPELIGVSGSFGSGKDSLAQVLVDEYGYTQVSTSDLVREVAMRERGSVERPVLREVAQECRERFGPGYFVEQGLDKPRPLVITGIRSLGEMKALKNAGGVMVYIDAPIEVRYQRMIDRARDAEADITLEAFRAREEKEMYGGDSDADFNIRAIGEQADIALMNDAGFEQFVERAMASLTTL